MTEVLGDRLFALHDSDSDRALREGMFPVTSDEARALNETGYGIFWLVNQFNGRRLIKNLERIRYWYVEIEEGSKSAQREWISKQPVVPSLMVESKRGYHLYFRAHDATQANYRTVEEYLIRAYKGDPNAKDLTRVLRAPGFKHMKNPSDPFEVKLVHKGGPTHMERAMLWLLAPKEEFSREALQAQMARLRGEGPQETEIQSGTFWDRVMKINQRRALETLSGTEAVNFEEITFGQTGDNGCTPILCDGKKTSAWIDAQGQIGSHSGAGPNIYKWVLWYRKDQPGEASRLLKLYLPELGV